MKKVRNVLIAVACIAVLFGVPALCIGNLNARSVTMTVGDSTELKLSNPLMQMAAHFVSDDGMVVATEEDGLIAAYNPGTTTVRVKTPLRTLKCKVYVLGFEKESTMMLEGQSAEPQVLGASEEAVFYSSDESVVQVTGKRIKTLKDGEATLVCEDKGLTVSQTIKVAGIISDKDYLFTGNKMQMRINDEISGRPANWSVDDTQVASIDANGMLEGVSAGSVVVSCQTESGKLLKTDVNIVGMKDADLYLLSGEDSGPPLVSGKGFDAEGMVWQSADTEVASVDTSGRVKAEGTGNTEVTGMLDGEEISGAVHVIEVPDQAFTAVGVSSKLQTEDGQPGIVWTSDDASMVKIEDGKLIGVSAGTSSITASAGSRTFTCAVSVGEVNTPSVTLDGSQTQTVEISGMDGQEAEWSSADTSIATVSESGEITPVGEGTTEVYCTIGMSTMTIPVTVDHSEVDENTAEEQAAAKVAAQEAEEQAAVEAAAQEAEEQAAAEAAAQEAEEKAAAKATEKSKSTSDSSKKTTKSKVKEPEQVSSNSGKLTGPEAIVACGDYYNSVLLNCSANGEKWVYSNSSKYVDQSGTFETMLKGSIRGGNCASIANWAFRDMGILSNSQKFYGNSSGKIQNYNSGGTSVKAALDSACDIIKTGGKTFKTLMSGGNIKVGDIIIGKGHTYIYRGNGTVFASGHDAKWHKDSSVKTDDPNKAVFDNWVRNYKGTYDEKFNVQYIIRMKDSFVPKYYRDAQGNLVKNQ